MTKREEYNLSFTKDNKTYYRCNMTKTNQESLALSELLNILGKYPEGLLDEIESVEKGEYFDDTYSFNVAPSDFGLKITPPNAIIEQMGYSYRILLPDLKQLLEEWLDFLKT